MAYDLKVSTGDVAARASRIQTEAAEIEARLGQLTTAMADLPGSWTGSAPRPSRTSTRAGTRRRSSPAMYDVWNNVHTASLEDYGITDRDLYFPDVAP